ncbi:MAG: 2-isopropylmalate synthase [Telmatospirillum sp.]|nr:2-isopropylmalate synthase [Telmatospirillum sp.]
MLTDPSTKYRPFPPPVDLKDRQWPSRRQNRAPRWLSTDLRDGNQALADPMGGIAKMRFYRMLLDIGFKEIEVAFPSASQTEFDFVRHLIEGGHIPGDVTPQVLTPARPDLIARTFQSLEGSQRAIVHLYNATAPLFRRVVFGSDRAGITRLAVDAAAAMRNESLTRPGTDWTFQYSPETFCFTEPDFALEICERVLEQWRPTPDRKAILNLPATVEVSMPHVFADQIEWFCRHLSCRDSVVISVHPHNDRGTGVAAAEQALLAGAARVEGCLFGNGERTGNVDLITLALNLYTQGVDPGLAFHDMQGIVRTVTQCNAIGVHPRHPYAGHLVHTAFSGSHQDAIAKGFEALRTRNDGVWEMPYLPIDPADLGGTYEAVIRVNSQSGKGGVAWVLQHDRGLRLPRRLQMEVARRVQAEAERSGCELTPGAVWDIFDGAYHPRGGGRFRLIDFRETGRSGATGPRRFAGRFLADGTEGAGTGRGDGVLSAVAAILADRFGVILDVADYHEHAIGRGVEAEAAAYIECLTPDGPVFGVGISTDSAAASVTALLNVAGALAPARQGD